MNVAFERPLFILIAIIAIPVIVFCSRFFKPLFSLNLAFAPPGGIPFKSPVNLKYLVRFLSALELSTVFLLCIAVAGPHVVRSEVIWLDRGADIIFAIDISPSMSGIDMDGRSRFDTARELLQDFADKRPQDAIGLIAFAEDAAILTPMTTDRPSLFARLDTLAIGEMGDATAIGTSLALAGFHMNNSQAPRRAVVLISDGENNSGSIHPETAAAVLGQMGVTLWLIGIGSGGIIPFSYVEPATQMFRSGTFESSFDQDNHRRIAESAGGHWIYAPTAAAFTEAFARLDRGEMIIHRSGSVRRHEPFHAVFIIAAIVIFSGVRFVKRRILGALV